MHRHWIEILMQIAFTCMETHWSSYVATCTADNSLRSDGTFTDEQEFGANLDAVTPKDWTPLSYARAKGKYGATEEKGIYPEVDHLLQKAMTLHILSTVFITTEGYMQLANIPAMH